MKTIKESILGMQLHVVNYSQSSDLIRNMITSGTKGYVCAANVHMTMEASDSPGFKKVINSARLVTPDGVPLVWFLRFLGYRQASRVYGPDLMLHLCRMSAAEGIPIGLYGSSPECLRALSARLISESKRLAITFAFSPPMMSEAILITKDMAKQINDSGCKILFVGLGCPKQEYWMNLNHSLLNPILVGVGAAFALNAGKLRQSPKFIQAIGFEWLFRLMIEPRRLFVRYAKNNPRFFVRALVELAHKRYGVNRHG